VLEVGLVAADGAGGVAEGAALKLLLLRARRVDVAEEDLDVLGRRGAPEVAPRAAPLDSASRSRMRPRSPSESSAEWASSSTESCEASETPRRKRSSARAVRPSFLRAMAARRSESHETSIDSLRKVLNAAGEELTA
jgi:hypothetical protein